MLELSLVVGLVVLTSAACSLFEAVLYSVPHSQIDALERAGHPSGGILRTLRAQVDRPIAAILSLNTVANTGGAALAGALASQVFASIWIGYFSAVFTLAILLFSEIIPKTAGVVYARRLVRRGLRSGDLKPHEADVIGNVLALEVKTAGQIMTPRTVLFMIHADTSLADVAANKQLLHHSRVPVYDNDPDDIVGIVHRRDILGSAARDEFHTTMDQLMHPVHFVVETAKLDHLLHTFLEQRQHLVVVTDEFGSISGIVTLEDVLEEILGREIVDEFDQLADLRAFARQQRAANRPTSPTPPAGRR